MMKRFGLGLILLVALGGASCAGNLPPASSVASVSANVEQTGLVILHAAQFAHQQTNPKTGAPLVSIKQLDYVALQCDHLGRLGTNIAQLLSAYSSAKGAKGDTTQLSVAIQAAVKSATDIVGLIGTAVPKGTVQAIDQAVASALGLYAQIKATTL